MTALGFLASLACIATLVLLVGLIASRWLSAGQASAHQSSRLGFLRTAAHAHAVLAIAIVLALVGPPLRWGALAAGWGMLPGGETASAPLQLREPPSIDIAAPNTARPFQQPGIVSLDAAPRGAAANDPSAAVASSAETPQINVDAAAAPSSAGHWPLLSARATSQLLFAGAIVWAVISLLLALRLIDSLLRTWRTLATAPDIQSPELLAKLHAGCELLGLRQPPRLVVADTTGSPAIWGWSRRPVLVAPATAEMATSPQASNLDWTAIFCHELAHLHRRDHCWALVSELAVIALPWNPLTWLARRRLAQLSELACDDWVLGTGHSGVSYADSLLSLTPRQAASLMPAAVSLRSNLAERIARLLMSRSIRPCVSRGVWTTICGAAIIGCAALAVAGPRPDEPPVADSAATQPSTSRQPLLTTEPAAVAPGEKSAVRLTGAVVDANGAPLPGAQVAVFAHQRRQHRGGNLSADQDVALASGTTNDAGRFDLVVPIAPDMEFYWVRVAAAAAGHAMNWVMLPPTVSVLAVQPPVEIKLPPEQIVRGRLLDPEGKPAAGVTVSVSGIGRSKARGEGSDGIRFIQPPEKMPLGPRPVVTDAEGRFEFRGLDGSAFFQVRDDRYMDRGFAAAPPKEPIQRTLSETKEPPKTNYLPNGDIEVPLSRAQYIEGTVRYADTGLPAPGTRLGASEGPFRAESIADEQGHFRIKGEPEEHYHLVAFPAERQPYLIKSQQGHWPAGTTRQTVDVELRRGTLIEGIVTEKASREFPDGRPIANAGIFYQPRVDNAAFPKDMVSGWQAMTTSDDEGRFWLAVPSGLGHLLVNAPNTNYIATLTSYGELADGKPGGTRYRPDGLVKLDIDEGTDKQPVAVELRRGVTLRGRLENPDGSVPERALIINPLHKYAFDIHWRGNPNYVDEGRFEVHGCDPTQPLKLSFLDPEKKTGATVELTGEQIAAMGQIVVRLAPCGSAVARYQDQHGKPIAGAWANLEIVVAPGSPGMTIKPGELMADAELLANVDRLNYWERRGGPDGVFEMPALIPGATYRVNRLVKQNWEIVREFQLKSGERIDLGAVIQEREEKPAAE